MAPTVTLSAANDLTVDEGSQHTYSFTVSDPGDDTFSVVSVSCGINGSQVGTTTMTATGGSFVCSFPDGPANSTVSVQVKDSDNANSNTATQIVDGRQRGADGDPVGGQRSDGQRGQQRDLQLHGQRPR